ncbi:hypothetical protein [Xanthomonas arboricola]|uniref:hypothetical protein n=1 Tax=Xanthomonas arboricola TaxID=56448 RepID=UPI000E1E3D68|nr:hypothetical protein [Xanthomonas arboricola]
MFQENVCNVAEPSWQANLHCGMVADFKRTQAIRKRWLLPVIDAVCARMHSASTARGAMS